MKTFDWIPFYTEFAKRLLTYRYDRAPLVTWIYDQLDPSYRNYLHDSNNEHLKDIDPFTVMGIFNRLIKNESRIEICKEFKSFLKIDADIPTDFAGVPLLNNMKSQFIGFKEKRGSDDINNHWDLFAAVVQESDDIETKFDTVRQQYGSRINISMGLFWIAPYRFIALDRLNRQYLSKYKIHIQNSLPTYKNYTLLINKLKTMMEAKEIPASTFPELSFNAFEEMGHDTDVDSPYEDALEDDTEQNHIVELWKQKKNIILQGAPGTGKTYMVPTLVTALCGRCSADDTREVVEAEYKKLVNEKRVVFTTFHQSMDYEDFIEGLKPVEKSGTISYEVEPGIFRNLCEKAKTPIVHDSGFQFADNPNIWKVSLMGTGDNPVRTECLKNDHIRIGWDKYQEDIDNSPIPVTDGRIVLDAFLNKMQIGDIVMSCYSQTEIDAIGVVTGEYEWHPEYDHYKRVRAVKWLVKNIREDIRTINNNTVMTLSTVYRLNNITLQKVMDILKKYKSLEVQSISDNNDPYILVIDEINRGNISKIFGELITLIEPDKRCDANGSHGIQITLPYSKKSFWVPSNVYIIATMNTADRSLGGIDYAIRRRFAFVPILPSSLKNEVEYFDDELFEKVSSLFVSNYKDCQESEHVEPEPSDYLSDDFTPSDVWIGQSYFIMSSDPSTAQNRLVYEIIPILREYIRDGVFKDIEGVNTVINEIKESYF